MREERRLSHLGEGFDVVDGGSDPGTVGVLVADHHLRASAVRVVGDLQNDVLVEPGRESFFERGGVDSVGQGSSPVPARRAAIGPSTW